MKAVIVHFVYTRGPVIQPKKFHCFIFCCNHIIDAKYQAILLMNLHDYFQWNIWFQRFFFRFHSLN